MKYGGVRLFIWLSFTSAAFAAPVGSIKGYVRDATGAVVPRVTVTLTDTATNARQQAVSGETGLFQFLQLRPGVYDLVSEAPGFKKVLVRGVNLLVDQVLAVDIRLEVGPVTEVLEVKSGAAALIETEKASTGTNISPKLVASLPLGNRRFDDLALLSPGTAMAAPGSQAGGFAPAGARPGSTNSVIDGVNNVDRQIGGPINNFRIADAVREFSVTTTAASVEYGRQSGGQVNIVTKSGSNQFHGGAFYFLRNDALEARDFFTNKLSGTKRALRQNQYGGTFGGPVSRDRSFFFYSWEGLRLRNPRPTTAVVPTQAERDSVRDPIARRLLAFYPLPTDPNVPGGRINYIGNAPQSTDDNTHLARFDHNPTAKDSLTARYIWFGGEVVTGGTLPGTGGSDNRPGSQNLAMTHTRWFSATLVSELRLGFSRNVVANEPQDRGFNAASIFTGVPGVVDTEKDGDSNSGLPGVAIAGGYATLGSGTNVRQGRVVGTYDVAANATRIAPFGWGRHTWRTGFDGRREETKRFVNGAARGVMAFANFVNFAGTCEACKGRSILNNSAILTGDTLGYWYRHPLGFFFQDDIKLLRNLTLNLGIRYELPSALVEKNDHATNFWEGIGAQMVGTNKVLDVDPSKRGPSALIYRDSPLTLPRAGSTTDWNNIAPVFGIAYRLCERTVIRGGFRIGYDETYNNVTVNQSVNPPWNFSTQQIAGVTQPVGGFAWDLAFDQNIPLVVRTTQAAGAPAVGVLGLNGFDNRAPTSYAYNWNFTVQRQLGNEGSVEAAYLGSSGHKLGGFVNPNQPRVVNYDTRFRGVQEPNEQIFPFPQWSAGPRSAAFQGNSIYNALAVSGKWEAGSSINLGGSYTWSHGIDDVSSFTGTTGDFSVPNNRFRTDLERGNSSSDQRHRLIAFYVIQMPFGNGKRFLHGAHGITEHLTAGWQISGITNIFSGQPFTVYANRGLDFSGFSTFVDRPDIVGTGKLRIDRGNPDNFFDPAYFGRVAGNPLCPGYAAASNVRVNTGCAPSGRTGSSPRNGYYGPGLVNFDVTLSKRFPIRERFGLTWRADFFNIANHTNFGLVSNNFIMSSGQFGQMSATSPHIYGAARVVQMTARLDF